MIRLRNAFKYLTSLLTTTKPSIVLSSLLLACLVFLCFKIQFIVMLNPLGLNCLIPVIAGISSCLLYFIKREFIVYPTKKYTPVRLKEMLIIFFLAFILCVGVKHYIANSKWLDINDLVPDLSALVPVIVGLFYDIDLVEGNYKKLVLFADNPEGQWIVKGLPDTDPKPLSDRIYNPEYIKYPNPEAAAIGYKWGGINWFIGTELPKLRDRKQSVSEFPNSNDVDSWLRTMLVSEKAIQAEIAKARNLSDRWDERCATLKERRIIFDNYVTEFHREFQGWAQRELNRNRWIVKKITLRLFKLATVTAQIK